MATQLNQIGQIAINVHDLERAISFYRDRLGMKHLFTVPGLAFFDCGGIRLMLGFAEKPEFDHPGSILYYKVEDISKAYEDLKQKDVQFEGKPHKIAEMKDHDLWMAFFRDSENNFLALMCEISR